MSSFVPIDKQNLERFVNACTLLQEIQHNDDEFDTDTLLNKYRDAIIADCLGFDMINDDKHGWDASDMTGRHFLEVKCVSTSSTSARATFNDTTDEKCDAFAKPGNYLALAVWSDIITILSYDDKRDDWIGFMRRKMEKTAELMSDDSVIFISIDDNRLIELCVICDDVFGRKNRIAIMVTHQSQRSNTKLINIVHEYVVSYAKNKSKARPFGIKRIDEPGGQALLRMQESVKKTFLADGRDSAQQILKQTKQQYLQEHGNGGRWISNYRLIDDDGTIIYPKDLSVPGKPSPRDISLDDGDVLHLDALPTRAWSSAEKILSLLRQDKVIFLDGRPYEKQALLNAVDSAYSLLPFYSRQGTEDLKRLDIGGLFDTPKPVALIRHLIGMTISGRDHLSVLDYFGGSGTTMQACMELKQSTDTTIDCDLVQIDEQMRVGTKTYDTAISLGILPRIPYATIKRLDTYLQASVDMDTFAWARSTTNNRTQSQEDIGLATLVLNRCCLSGYIDGGVIGGKHQNGKYKLDSRFNKKTITKNIAIVGRMADEGIIRFIGPNDAVSVIKDAIADVNAGETAPDDLFLYVDPPYMRMGNRCYKEKVDHDELCSALSEANAAGIQWLLSYDDCPEVRDMYRGMNMTYLDMSYSSNASTRGKVTELLISNDDFLS